MNPEKTASTDTLDAAAGQWLARRDRALTPAEQDAYLQWLRQDPRHGQALARLEKTWSMLNGLKQWRPAHSPQPNADLLVAPRRRRWQAGAVLLGTAASIVLALVLWQPKPATGGYERRTLSDGSLVELNRGAVVDEHFSAHERRVDLVEGEANFTVARNSARPFVVRAGQVAVCALGTVFNVRLRSGAVEVIVTEGKVRVDQPAGSGRSQLEAPVLVAGQRAVIPAGNVAQPPVVAELSPREISAALAWQPQRLQFADMSLGAVVAEFNLHNRQQLVIGDADLASMRVGGNFRADNADAFVRLLEASFGVKVERRSETELVLRKSP